MHKNYYPGNPGTDGLIPTTYQNKILVKKIEQGMQIIHDRGNHWIVASTLHSSKAVVQIYDSVYDSLDEGTKNVICNLFKLSRYLLAKMQKQVGGQDCGLFAIAVVLSLLIRVDVADVYLINPK